MCVISQLSCPKCGCEPDGYVFSPCGDLIKQVFDRLDDTFVGHRLYCPNFVWPPRGPVPVKIQHCEECIFRPVSSSRVRRVDKDNAGVTADSLGKVIVKQLTVFEAALAASVRNSDREHRFLTLRIPYCPSCREPYYCLSDNKNALTWLNDDKTAAVDEELAQPTIEGIEFEFSSFLWKWIRLVQLWQIKGHEAIETNIQTGFIHRPCDTCINREVVLRGRLSLYLESCENAEAWAVWMWLMMRGSGEVNFWWHQIGNMGLPNLPPPRVLQYRALMAAGWKARTGVAWEYMYDVELGEHPLLFTPHDEVFKSLSQWNAFAGIRGRPDPVAMLPPPPMDTNNITLDYKPSVEYADGQGTTRHEHRPEQSSGAANNYGGLGRRTMTPPQLPQLTSALHKTGNTAKLNRGNGSDCSKDHPAKRLRFSEEVDVLGDDSHLPVNHFDPESSSPADSDHTLVENGEGDGSSDNEDLFDDTVAVLVNCQYGYRHVRNMDPNDSWNLPLGVELQEGTPIAPPQREEPAAPAAPEAEDKGKGSEVAETQAKGEGPESAETKGKGKRKKRVVVKDQRLWQEKLRQRRESGEYKLNPEVLSSDDSSVSESD